MPNVNLIAVSDLSKKALNDAKNAGIKRTFTNYEKLLNESSIDAVIIALPTHLHTKCAIQAVEAGKHIFLEKPIARNLEEAKSIVTAARKNYVELMIGYPFRFNQSFRELKTKMENGSLGDVEIVHATYLSSGPFSHRTESGNPTPVPNWWFNKDLTGGGALLDLGSHLINLLRWYFGEVKDIKSHLGYRFNFDFEDSALCFIKFESGTTAVMTTGWFFQGYHLNVEFFGTVDHAFAQHRPKSVLTAPNQLLTPTKSEFFQPHFDELQYFAYCLLKGLSPSPSGKDGLKDLEAIYQAYHNSIRLD